MSQAVYQGSPRRQATNSSQRKSGAVAAFLSFIFPGLGQAYLGRRREALMFAVPVLVLLGVLLLWVITSGLTRAGVQLLDTSTAGIAAILSVIVVVWWAVGIVAAWRAGYHSSPISVAVPVVLLAILLVLSVSDRVPASAAWFYGISVADNKITGGVDCTVQACDYGTPQPLQTTDQIADLYTLPPPQSLSPGETASPTDTSTDDGDDDANPSEPPPTLDPGPTPGFDITSVDAQNDGWLNVLLIGLDTRCAGGIVTGANSDTMIVVSVDESNNHLYMFSFPRDTSQFPLYDGAQTFNGKLNQFAGWTKGQTNPNGTPRYPDPGQPALADEIGFLLGIPIDYYASINICGFPQLIDAVGGVDVCNTKTIDDPTYYWAGTNHAPGFYLGPGEYHMDGNLALAYARSRHGSSDFARAKRQQQLLTAIRQAILSPQNISKLPDIISAMAGVVTTNFPPSLLSDPNHGLLALANQVDATPTAQYVFEFPDWATHYNRQLTNGRSVQYLDMSKMATLSYQIFGNASLYAKHGPPPSVTLPQPTPSASPGPGVTPPC